MSSQRKFFGARPMAGGRQSFDQGRLINPKYVPPSRHAIFIRGLPSDIDNHKIRDFFQEASNSSCGIDFTSYNEELRKLSIALRFESHDIAKEMLTRFNNTEIFGHRVEVTWFKDLKKARDRMIDERRAPYDDHRTNYRPNRFENDRRDNRDWSDSRKRLQTNNQNHSRSLERGEANSETSYNHKRSSDYDRSRSKSSVHSIPSESGSEDHIRRSIPIKDNKEKLSKIIPLEKPVAYVDLDDSDSIVQAVKRNERIAPQPDNSVEDGSYKQDLDEKKKKKKKRKRRRMEHSGSQDSYQEPSKVPKVEDSADKVDVNKYSAIAGDLNNWKQAASDSDDYLSKNNQLVKPKSRIPMHNEDKLNDEKHVKMLKLKSESIERTYRKDSETYSSVINVLIRKAPELKTKLESLMKEILVEASNQCVDLMRDYILHLSEDSNHVDRSMSPTSSL